MLYCQTWYLYTVIDLLCLFSSSFLVINCKAIGSSYLLFLYLQIHDIFQHIFVFNDPFTEQRPLLLFINKKFYIFNIPKLDMIIMCTYLSFYCFVRWSLTYPNLTYQEYSLILTHGSEPINYLQSDSLIHVQKYGYLGKAVS